MAAKPTLLLSPDGSWDQNGRVVPTIAGGVRVVPGKNGNAWQISQATTNLILNPRFDPAGTLWSTSNVTRSDDGALTPGGIPTARYATNTSNVLPYIYQLLPTGSVTAGLAYSGRLWVKCSVGGRLTRLQITWRDAAGAQISVVYGPYTTTIANEWVEVRFDNAIAPANAVGILFLPRFGETSSLAGEAWHVGEPQFEQISYCTPYADGTLGSGFAWTGTVNASTSTRAAAYVYTTIAGRADINRGSMMMRYRLNRAPRSSAYLFGIGGLSGPSAKAYYTLWRTGTNWAYRDNTATISTTYRPTPNTAGDYIAYFAWDETTVWFDYGDGVMQSVPRAAHDGSWFSDRLNLLSYATGGQVNSTTEGALIFDGPLTDTERAEYLAMPSWTWNNTFSQLAESSFSSYISSVFAIEPSVYKTDKFNRSRDDISQFVSHISVDGDADRSGSKLACNIETFAEILDDGDWIAPYVTVAPETGDITTSQMGHYRVDPPTVDYTSNGEAMLSATAVDILDLLSKVKLTTTFFTPQRSDPIQDIRVLLSMATRGYVGPNLVQNPSFETQDTPGSPNLWSAPLWVAGGSGTFTDTNTPYEIPTGSRVWAVTFNASQVAGAMAALSQTITIPQDAIRQNVWITGIWMPSHADHRGYLRVDFYDAGTNLIDGASIVTRVGQRPSGRYIRESAYGKVPENAATCIFRVYVVDAVGGYPQTRRTSFEDVAMHITSSEPMPEEMFSFPDYDIYTTSRIQTVPPASYLEAADERFVSAGHQPLFPLLDSRVTTRKIGKLETGTVARKYDEYDSRIVSTFRVERSAVERFNTIYAVSEDTTTGMALYAVAVNDDPGDQFSAYNYGVVSDVISVSGSTQEDLQRIADEKLANASTQEELVISVLPDPLIGFHDIIEVVSKTRAAGRWSIVSIKWGMDSADALVEIRARRLLKRVA